MNIQLNERNIDRLTAISKRRAMSIEDCAHGLIQQAMRSWELNIHAEKWTAKMGCPTDPSDPE